MKANCKSIEKHKSGQSTVTFEAEGKVLAIFNLTTVETEQEMYKEGEESDLKGYELRSLSSNQVMESPQSVGPRRAGSWGSAAWSP